MSSVGTRTEIKNYFTANIPSESFLVDLSGENRTILDVAKAYGITINDDWVAIQFIGNSEDVISTPAVCFRETGTIYFHVIAPMEIGAIDDILTRCETIIAQYRSKRINDIIIESTSPPNTERGTTIEFDNGFTSASFFIDYYRDIKI